MYESQTFEQILQRMLDRIPDTIDKREGSIIYDAMAPAAVELAQMYVELDINANLRFPDSASGDYLDRSIAWSGIQRKQATKARLSGLFWDKANQPLDVPIGGRYSLSDLNYKVIEKIQKGNFILECETAGSIGNSFFGQLLPLDYITGLVRAELTELILPGEEIENDESLYERYQDKITKPITSGNRYQYELWAREVSGVGKARAFPLWQGPGTVRVALLDNNMRRPADAVIQEVQQYIDPSQDGKGEGVAPIGPVVTVEGANEIAINISVDVTLAEGANVESVKEAIETGVSDYLKSLAFNDTLVRYTRIANVVLDIPRVIDYVNLKVSDLEGKNIQINEDEVAVLGIVTVNKV
ncbi:baseplate J/gp47 family protein [Paenibacillus enshidis]|uniref:Baseplate J/gp47 family protein n=1 Tax=Paenibacillus enshidis TaxID=1458439 RepID=A0ABV5AS89_9BACL